MVEKSLYSQNKKVGAQSLVESWHYGQKSLHSSFKLHSWHLDQAIRPSLKKMFVLLTLKNIWGSIGSRKSQ
jgi:hypothetical protein